MIAIHGGPGGDMAQFEGDFAPLAAKHTVIFYDQRGGGGSELPSDTMRLVYTRQIADLDELRLHFKLKTVTLVAHSYGPLLAASYALAHPSAVKKMVFFGPVPPYGKDFWKRFGENFNAKLDSTQRRQLAERGRRMRDPQLDARQTCRDYWAIAIRPRLAEPDRTLPLLKSDLCASSIEAMRYSGATSNRVIMGSYGDWDLRERLRTLQVPTLVFHGEQEAIPMDMVEQWVTSLPHARLVKVPRAAHFAYAERPEIVWPEVEKFLASK